MRKFIHLAMTVAVVAACAGTQGTTPTLSPQPIPDWLPLSVDAVPSPLHIQADRDAFGDHVAGLSAAQAEGARTSERWATSFAWVGAAMLILPLLSNAEYYTGIGPALTFGAVSAAMKRKARQHMLCRDFLFTMQDGFELKWSGERIPSTTDAWREYRRDQQNILGQGPC